MPVAEFKPIQPYFVLNTDSHYLKHNVDFGGIAHVYSFTTDNCFSHKLAVADGCVDIVFRLDPDQPQAWVYGSTIQPTASVFEQHQQYFGIRYHLGATPNFLRVPPKELLVRRVDLCDVYRDGKTLLEQMLATEHFTDRLALILNRPALFSSDQTPDVCKLLTQQMIQSQGNIRINDLTDYTHYSIRSINHLFHQYYGLTPKTFCLILRNQRALHALTQPRRRLLTHLAQDLGYADQSHFLNEFKRYNVMSPKKFTQAIDSHQYQQHIVLR